MLNVTDRDCVTVFYLLIDYNPTSDLVDYKIWDIVEERVYDFV